MEDHKQTKKQLNGEQADQRQKVTAPKFRKTRTDRKITSLILLGFAIGLFYWVMETAVHVFVFCDGDFIEHAFFLDPHELWTRSFVVFCFVVFGVSAYRMITKCTRAESALQESEERFRAFMDNSPFTVYIKDESLRHIYGNARILKAADMAFDEFVGSSAYDVLPKDIAEKKEASDRKVLEEGVIVDTEESTTLQGSEQAWWRDVKFPINMPSGQKLVGGIAISTTERKKLERTLSSERDKFDFILKKLPIGVTILDSEDKYVYINPAALRIDGFADSRDGLIGKDVRSNHPKHVLPKVEQLLDDFKSGEKSFYSREAKRRKRTVEISHHALRNLKGKYQGLVRLVSDITERKQAEETLKKAMEAADSANRAKSAFLANMSHELRTPLNAIMGFTQILEMDTETFSDQQLEYLNHIASSGNHLLEMVNDILDLSKVEAGRIEIETKPFSLNAMLERVPAMVDSLARRKKITVELNIDVNLGLIEADEVRLKQVIYNLLSNAIKFTDFSKRIGIDSQRRDDWIIIEVWDEGMGIAEQDLEKIFDPFQQVGRANHDKPEGTGLGMAISRRLVELQGGTLTVQSNLGKGSRFVLCLPAPVDRGNQEVRQRRVDTPRKKRRADSEKILLVEDNELNTALIISALDRVGYKVHAEQLAEQGVNAALNERYDLILMDIQLPDISGNEAMKKIREKAEENIPIIALTAYAMKGDEQRFLQEGFDGYISKPIDIKKMQRKIEELLKSKQVE